MWAKLKDAVKLDLPEFEKWVENELNSYPSGDVPDDRILVGQVKGQNPFHGWRPVNFNETKFRRTQLSSGADNPRELLWNRFVFFNHIGQQVFIFVANEDLVRGK
jgi:hypothetical protein